MNMTAFHLSLDFLYAKGVIDTGRQEMLRRQHETNLEIVRRGLYRYVSSQKGVTVFLETVQDLIQDPARFHIENWPGSPYQDHKNSKPVGFYDPKYPDIFFLYSGPAYSAASEEMRKRSQRLHPQTTIGKQLLAEKHLHDELVDQSDASCSKQVLAPNRARVRAWAVKLSSLGYEAPTPIKKVLTNTA